MCNFFHIRLIYIIDSITNLSASDSITPTYQINIDTIIFKCFYNCFLRMGIFHILISMVTILHLHISIRKSRAVIIQLNLLRAV